MEERETKERGMRMREVTRATGLPKSTILHYISQGLLPGPIKAGRNTALYDPSCVERARFIRSVQAAYSFPLEKIRCLLAMKDAGKDMGPLIELQAAVFGADGGSGIDEKALMAETGLTSQQLSELLASGLLMPLAEGRYGADDVEAARVYAGGFRLGVTVSDIAFYHTLAVELVEHEMRLRNRLTAHMPDDQDAVVTTGLTTGARVIRRYVTNRVFQHRVAAMQNLKDEKEPQ